MVTNEETSEAQMVPINVTSDTSLVVSGNNTVDLSWDATDTPGTYTLSYDCVPGLTAILVADGGERELSCETSYNLGDVETASVTLFSAENRYADFRYEIAFLRTNETEPSGVGNAAITVFNTDVENLQSTSSSAEVNNGVVDDSTDQTPKPTTPSEEVITEERPSTPPTSSYEQEYVYSIPSSDPNGRPDLAVRFLETGTITNGQFLPSPLARDTAGAIRFEVKNLGTKTSDTWTYTIDLPTGGEVRFPRTGSTETE